MSEARPEGSRAARRAGAASQAHTTPKPAAWACVPFYPLLIALLPVLALYAENAAFLEPGELVLPLVVASVIAGVAFGAVRLALRDTRRAALVSGVGLLWFFAYGHWRTLLARVEASIVGDPIGLASDRALYLIGSFALVVAVVAVRRDRRWLPAVTRALNFILLVLIIVNLLNVFRGEFEAAQFRFRPELAANATASPGPAAPRCGDIYYMVLDAYGRHDVLRDMYGYDNRPFLDFLADSGFFVAEHGRSNYPQTLLTLAAALNFDYLDDVAEQVGLDTRDRSPLARMIRDSELFALARARGYRIVTFDAMPVRLAKVEIGDPHFDPPLWTPSAFWAELIKLTASSALLEHEGLTKHREYVLYAFRHLEEVPDLPGRSLAFFHVLSPHQPFVMDSAGGLVEASETELSIFEPVEGEQERRAYVSGYRQQAIHVSELVRRAVGRIIAAGGDSLPPAIVILGDHGPASRLDTASIARTDLRERFGILHAVRLPGYDGAAFTPDLSPVNAARIVAGHCFGVPLPPLEDRSYFSTWQRPYRFIPVADSVLAPPPATSPP